MPQYDLYHDVGGGYMIIFCLLADGLDMHLLSLLRQTAELEVFNHPLRSHFRARLTRSIRQLPCVGKQKNKQNRL